MSKQTLILIIILFFFTSGLLYLALNKSSYSPKTTLAKPILPTPTINPYSPDTSLLFGELQTVLATVSASVDSVATATTTAAIIQQNKPNTYSIPIIINTGANNVTAAQLELAFDPNVLTDVNINPSVFFQNPIILLNKIDSNQGRISYALGIEPSASENNPGRTTENDALVTGKKGEGTLAILTFKTTAKSDLARSQLTEAKTASDAAETAITFLPKTFVVAEGIAKSALKSTNSAEIKLE